MVGGGEERFGIEGVEVVRVNVLFKKVGNEEEKRKIYSSWMRNI